MRAVECIHCLLCSANFMVDFLYLRRYEIAQYIGCVCVQMYVVYCLCMWYFICMFILYLDPHFKNQLNIFEKTVYTLATMLEICLPLSFVFGVFMCYLYLCMFFLPCCRPFSVRRYLLLAATEGKRLLFLATENGCLNLEFVIRHIRAIVLTRTEIIFYSNI